MPYADMRKRENRRDTAVLGSKCTPKLRADQRPANPGAQSGAWGIKETLPQEDLQKGRLVPPAVKKSAFTAAVKPVPTREAQEHTRPL